jgi:hypothetical protein
MTMPISQQAVPISHQMPQLLSGAFFLLLGVGVIVAFGRRVTCGVLFWAFVSMAIGATLIIVVLTVHDG